MGEMADDYDLYYGPWDGGEGHTVVCSRCGTPDLTWAEWGPDDWYLVDRYGDEHVCRYNAFAEFEDVL